jgi:hypothetical protein
MHYWQSVKSTESTACCMDEQIRVHATKAMEHNCKCMRRTVAYNWYITANKVSCMTGGRLDFETDAKNGREQSQRTISFR